MPRHCCPGNSDCCIDCPGGGAAAFHEPLGPCERRCDEPGFGESLLALPDDLLLRRRFSGVVHQYPVVHIGSFARALDRRKLPRGASEIHELIRLAEERRGARIDASWQETDLVGMLEVLVDASSSSMSGELQPA